MKHWFFISLILSTTTHAADTGAPSAAGVPSTATSWQCHVRCYRDKGEGKYTWLSQKNDLVVACAEFPDVQSAIDIQCRSLYGDAGSKDILGYLNWPASPGTLAACKNVGQKCTAGKTYRVVWECGMSCKSGGRDYPSRASVCAPSQKSSYEAALDIYRTEGKRPACRKGWELSREVGTEVFDDPAWSMCRNTEKECDIIASTPL